MMKKDMRKALGSSLEAEENAVKSRFERAETVLAKTAAVASTAREPKREDRVVRDSFTMPSDEYVQIAALKQRGLARGVSATKSEILRAGLATLKGMDDKKLAETLARVPKVKTGRPAPKGA